MVFYVFFFSFQDFSDLIALSNLIFNTFFYSPDNVCYLSVASYKRSNNVIKKILLTKPVGTPSLKMSYAFHPDNFFLFCKWDEVTVSCLLNTFTIEYTYPYFCINII